MFQKYPFVHQTGIKDCAAASLLMIIKYYKGYINIDSLSDMLETNRNGTTAYNIVKVANQIGFSAKGIKTDLEKINNSNIILPCIAHVIIDNKYKHYIVIYKIDFKSKILLIGDPQDRIKKMTFKEFSDIWTNVLLVLYPKTPIPRNNNNSLFDYIFNILQKYRTDLLMIILISLLLMLFSIGTSFYFKYIIDSINYPKQSVILIFFVFTFIYLFRILTDFCRNKLLIYFNQKVDLDINLDTFKQVLSLPYHYYRNRTTGEIITKINNLDSVRDMISRVFLSIFVDIPLSFISMVILYLISPKLFFVAIIILLLYIFIVLIYQKTLIDKMAKVHKRKASVNSFMTESITGFETVKGLRIENYINDSYEKEYVKYLKSLFSLHKTYTNQIFLKDIINTFGQAVIIFFGSLLVIQKEMTLGTLLTFNTILVYFLDPLKNVIDLDYIIKEAKVSLKNVLNMLETNEKISSLNKEVKGSIKIKNLSFELDNKMILDSINISIEEGSKTLIIGRSGSGKSTLMKILMKYYAINRNTIFIDNLDYNDCKIDNVKYISQQEILFTDTLYNNIALDNDNIDKFLEIARLCKIDDIIKDNNTGYNMLIEENGFNISGGQRQRIILARTLMQKFNVLLIDEGLNQVDINMERQILKNIFEKFKDKTFIIISHRLDNMDLFNQVIELNDGKITKDLIKNG